MQAGVGIQQDLALVGWLGLTHVERNGHHYVNGMSALPPKEQARFAEDHATLYEESAGATRLHIAHGDIDLSRSEEHTSELQSLMRISYAVFCLNKKHNKKPTYKQKH